ncbi:MAG: hypothetical protein ACREQL_07920 [Candidatus Binatia bacterium]
MDPLARADLDRFLRTLARRLPCPVRLVLTGGAEAMLLGGIRPTGDLDFALVVAEQFEAHWPAVEAAVAAARDEAGIAVQFATDIDRWSSVSIPAARRRTRAFRRIGRLSVHLVEPTCWAVYKLTRYLDSDVEDLRAVLRRQRVSWRPLARLCGESLRTSPRSTQLRLFRQQVEHFLRTYGSGVWGATFDPERAISVFRRAASIASD